MKHHLFWHEPSNSLAVFQLGDGLPLVEVLDKEFTGINPFFAMPLSYLVQYVGWVDLGELK